MRQKHNLAATGPLGWSRKQWEFRLSTRPGFNNVLRARVAPWCFCLLLGSASAAVTAATDVGDIDALVRQWLAIEQQAASLASDWRQQEPVLEQRIALLEAEKAQLSRVLEDNQDVHSDVEARRAALLAEQAAMETGQRQAAAQLQLIGRQLKALSAQLPPPLLAAWQEEQAMLAADASASEQLQVALAQLSKLIAFDNRVTVHEATVVDPEGRRVLVKQLYLGAGIAWFVSGDGSVAGTGGPTPDGWQWRFDEDIDSERIKNAIAIHEKREEADLVSLPLRLSGDAR